MNASEAELQEASFKKKTVSASWQQNVCFVGGAVASFFSSFLWQIDETLGQVFSCDPLFADARRDLHVPCLRDCFMPCGEHIIRNA